MKVIKYPKKAKWGQYLKRPESDQENLEGVIGNILHEVRQNGDTALRYFTSKFDRCDIKSFLVTESEIENAIQNIDSELKTAISIAAGNIEKFHISQKREFKKIETTKGVFCWQKQVSINTVGLYVPGGTAPLFSTLLMLVQDRHLSS